MNFRRTVLVMSVFWTFGIAPALADEFTVNKEHDNIDADPGSAVCDADLINEGSQCTLRTAVMEANALAGEDTIVLGENTYTLSLTGDGEDGALTGDLDVTDDLIIEGAGQTLTIIDAAQIDRVFHLDPGDGETPVNVTIRNLTITGGEVTTDPYKGAGIFNLGNLTLTNVTLTGNTIDYSENQGGGLYHSDNDLTITGCLISDNHLGMDGKGGGLYFGSASSAYGTIDDTVIDGNTTFSPMNGGCGGGIRHSYGDLSITHSTISNNQSGGDGGGLAGCTGSLELIDVEFVGNVAFDDSDPYGTTGAEGGSGVSVIGQCEVSISACRFTQNTAKNHDEGDPGANGRGGGIYIGSGGGELVLIENSLIDNNWTNGFGGGFYLSQTVVDQAALVNTTIANNGALFRHQRQQCHSLSGLHCDFRYAVMGRWRDRS